MIKKFQQWWFCVCLLISGMMALAQDVEDALTIAILAPMGAQETLESWQGFQTLLASHLDRSVVVLPVTFEEFQTVAKDASVDLLIANQTAFLSIFPEVKWRWLASLDQNSALFNPESAIGSAIVVRKNSQIRTLEDLKGQRVTAVSKDALGGFLLGYKAIYDAGLSAPDDYFIEMTGFPIERGIFLVESGLAAAAILPTCLLETLGQSGLLNVADFRVLNEVQGGRCRSSTPLSYHWSLAALPSVDEALAQKIVQILWQNTDPALTTWQTPSSLGEVYAMKRFAGLIEIDETLWETFVRLANEYKLGLLAIILLMLVLAMNHLWLTYVARKRRFALESTYHRLHDYEALLSKADRMNILGEVASGIGHELNQPLMAIRNYAEGTLLGIERGKAPNQFIQPLSRIVTQVEQCSAIIKNLQAWVKPKTTQQFEWFNFHDFMNRMLEIIRLQTKNRVAITLDINCEQQIYTVVSVLEQVMMNSLLNAVQAGATEINIEASCHQDFYKILISDNGHGFTQSELDAPFVPFRTSKPTGLGLGLVICDRLMTAVGGKFRIDHRKDGIKGACVRIILSSGSQQEAKDEDTHRG